MIKKIPILLALTLSACSGQQQKTVKEPFQDFYNTHLFFNLETEAERVPCEIQGKIPDWLSGTLLRNGPAKFSVDDKRVSWFDGLAMLHAFEFTPQTVHYSNRFIRGQQYYMMMDEKSLNFEGFAHDPCAKIFKNLLTLFIPKEMKNVQNADVTIQDYADKMVALTERPLPVVFDPNTLATIGNFDYEDNLPKNKIWESAHAQHNIQAKETYNYFVRFGVKSSYVVWKMLDHQSKREVVNEIPVDLPAYMHSFALTEHYQILVEFPFVVNPMDLMRGKKPFIFNYKWKPQRGTTFYVTDLSTGKLVAQLKDEAFFAFHHVNAFDKDGKIFMDICTHPNPNVIALVTDTLVSKEKVEQAQMTKLERFTIDMSTKQLSKETIINKPLEMPRVPTDRTAHEYRYCYAVDTMFPRTVEDVRPLYKVDTVEKNTKEWSEAGCLPGEPIFVPRPGGTDEDDGVVLSVVLDFAHMRSFLLVMDAANWTELARASIPHAIPLGLHGLWNAPGISKSTQDGLPLD